LCKRLSPLAVVPNQLVCSMCLPDYPVSSLRIKVLNDADEFAALGKSWQALAAVDTKTSFFNDWHWNNLWWQHHQYLGQLHVLLVYQEHRLVGLAPFYKDQSKVLGLIRQTTLRFLGTGGNTSPDDLNVLAEPGIRTEVCESVCHFVFADFSIQRMLLADVPVDSEFYKVFTRIALEKHGYAINPAVSHRRCTALPNEWPEFREQISRNTHKQIKRRFNRLKSVGNTHMQVCNSLDETNAAYSALVDLHLARWDRKKQGGSTSFTSPVYVEFHRALVQKLFSTEQLRLVTLKLDDKIIAVEYALVYNETLMFFQTGFNPDFEHLSPGHVLMTFAIKHAIESGLKKIDLLKGDYEYKNSYAREVVESASIGHYRAGWVSKLAQLNDLRKR